MFAYSKNNQLYIFEIVDNLPVLLYDFLYKKAWFVVAVQEDIAIPLFFSRKIHVYLRFNEYAN